MTNREYQVSGGLFGVKEIADAVKPGYAAQILRRVMKNQGLLALHGGTLPRQQNRHAAGIDLRQSCKVNFSLTPCNSRQAGLQGLLGVIHSECQRRRKHQAFEPFAMLSLNFLFLSVSALIKPSMPPLPISVAKLPL